MWERVACIFWEGWGGDGEADGGGSNTKASGQGGGETRGVAWVMYGHVLCDGCSCDEGELARVMGI